jgi:hypothetical protein
MTRSPAAVAGLTDAEVAQRVAEGKSNDVPERTARSIAEIVRANVFTRINAILGVLLRGGFGPGCSACNRGCGTSRLGPRPARASKAAGAPASRVLPAN